MRQIAAGIASAGNRAFNALPLANGGARKIMALHNHLHEIDGKEGYTWFWRLRWIAGSSVAVASLMAGLGFSILLPWGIIGAAAACIFLTNAWCTPARMDATGHLRTATRALIGIDVLLLTAILYFTGGAHNPFTMLYLLHITIAVILLPTWEGAAVVGLTSACFGILFVSPHLLLTKSGYHLCCDMDAHLKGMVLGLVTSGGGVAYFVGSLTAALRKKKDEISKLSEMMLRQRQMAGIGALATGVAHEMATPLGTIALIGRDLEKLGNNPADDEQLRKDAQLILAEVDRCQCVLKGLGEKAADLTASETSETLDLDKMLHGLRMALPQDQFNRISCKQLGGGSLRLPPQEFLMMVLNVIRNAIEASTADAKIELAWEKRGTDITIKVSDRGSGMPPRQLEKATKPFFTTKSGSNGLGLGLYLVEAFCERHEGAFEIDSAEGEGTTVTLTFPAASKTPARTGNR